MGTYYIVGKQLKREQHLHLKAQEYMAGFLLIYVPMAYSAILSYLKGLHLTLSSWRPRRDSDRWKLLVYQFEMVSHEKHPAFAKGMHRLVLGVQQEGLIKLLAHAKPHIVLLSV